MRIEARRFGSEGRSRRSDRGPEQGVRRLGGSGIGQWRCHFIAPAPSCRHQVLSATVDPVSSIRSACTIKTGRRGTLMIQVHLTNGVRLKTDSTVCTLCIHEISKVGLTTCIAMASESKAVCVLERVVRGHYIYTATWTPSVGEILAVHV